MTRSRCKSLLTLSVGLFLSLAGAVPTHAESNGRVPSLPERAQGSSKVVVARVGHSSASWRTNAFGDRLIVSRFLLAVEETLKGSATSDADVEIEGGTLDGLTLRVSDLPALQEGDRAVFFLEDAGGATFRPHLRGKGILRLDADDMVPGTSLHLNDIRNLARQAR